MQSSTSIQKWSEALSLAQSEFRAVGMSGENKFDRYVYAKLEDYVAAVRPILAKHGLSVVTSVDDVVALEDRKTAKGGLEHAVRVKMTVRIGHQSGEWVEATCWGEGQDRADKAVYKAITGARKYALASALGLATGDDPEGDEGVGQTAAPHTHNNVTRRTPDVDALVEELQELIVMQDTPQETVNKWLERAKVRDLSAMPADKLAKCIESLKAKRQPVGAA